jgi:hypothetical protein
MAMPVVASIAVMQAKPNDVIVFECDTEISQQVVVRLRMEGERLWPGRKIAVLSRGFHLKVMHQA